MDLPDDAKHNVNVLHGTNTAKKRRLKSLQARMSAMKVCNPRISFMIVFVKGQHFKDKMQLTSRWTNPTCRQSETMVVQRTTEIHDCCG